ncbi:hypothetical protein DSCO28_12380 [Desulfosarcina ovata subsp. sediminis]|uniref:YibE/F family protein n=1 Tax=Desulfosarcina ovata subsp. sediminis TaxID=885957 RepID=A0A5K7ZF32_9BACT|nr:YibE/F family protein [Desulfosarcina ovata]BBO80672.1 hypothetical protein DSCO28_12380 [Desulfosarcina ovata subsp. sediminis]
MFRNTSAKIQSVASSLKSFSFLVSAALIFFTAIIIISISRMDYTKYSKGMAGATITYEKCRILSILDESLKKSTYSSNILVGNQKLEIKMLTGKHKGETLTASNYLSTYNSVVAQKGQKLTVIVDELDSGKFKIRVYNYDRAPYIYLFAFVFLLTMVVVSGKKGLMSCLSLIYTFVCILLIFLPLIMRGYSPVWVAIGLVILVTSANMIFLNGISKKTFCAIMGTASGVILSGIILIIFSKLMHVSGFNLEEAESLLFIRQKTGLGVENILFAGILIASMGAVMDTALSIVSAINELHANMPNFGAMKLFKAGMNVGKDMIGTMSNTLILAFAGAALSTIIVLHFYSVQYNHLINSNFVAIEIAQALSGSMAVVLTIPLTAAITARILEPV